MSAICVCLLTLSASYILNIVADGVVQDFYWRDYIPGDLPYDAFEASDGRYIAQVNYQGDNAVGTLYPYNNQAVIEMGKKIIIKENIKILCSQMCDRFYWEFVNFSSPHSNQMKNAVRGGLQSTTKILFIGKAIADGEWRIGKVVEIENVDRGLWIWHDNEQKYHLKEFYLLKYNESIESTCRAP